MQEEQDERRVRRLSRRRERRKRQKILVLELFLDFARNTTLHGLKYVAENGLSVLEKLFWLLTFLLSVGLCSFLIGKVWIKWKISPVIVSYNEHIVPIGMVPFPSITICPQIKSKRSVFSFTDAFIRNKNHVYEDSDEHDYVMDNQTEYSRNDTVVQSDEDQLLLEKLAKIALICDLGNVIVESNSEHMDATAVDQIDEVSPTMFDVFDRCTWRGENVNCSDIFNRVLTGEGVCYTFNGLSANEMFRDDNIQQDYGYLDSTEECKGWNLSHGYYDEELDPYPRRGRENGAGPDMEIILKADQSNKDLICNGINTGYKIYVQHPADMPTNSLYYYAVMPNQVTSVALKLTMLTTSPNLESYPPETRQCYFPSDRELKYFKVYTESNCRMECQSNYTYELCGCVFFNMPFHDSRVICHPRKRDCVKTGIFLSLYEQMLPGIEVIFPKLCQCLPECDRIHYDAEILKTDFDLISYLESFNQTHQSNQTSDSEYQEYLNSYNKSLNYSKIEIYFKEPQFMSMRRSELFGVTDFLGYCGGLLGLFLGFSLLSFVEIIYFLTLRLICTLWRDLKAEKANKRREENL